MKGLDLNERYYREAVRPVLDTYLPDLVHSAALIGWSSEVLGFDDDTSTDHNWGPRFWLFLSNEDAKIYSDEVDKCLADNLPAEFLGHPIAFEYIEQRGERKYHRHNINIDTVAEYFKQYLGADLGGELSPADWLTFPQHKLRGVTSGRVFYDGLGELEHARRLLAYYPRDVWYYMLAAQWLKIFEEQAFIGRCGQVGDDLGAAVIGARQVDNLIHLCFLIERVYAPYSKWLGTAFSKLESAAELAPIFIEVLGAAGWKEKERKLAGAYPLVIRRFNSLGIVEPMSEEVSPYFSRPMLTIQDESAVENLLGAIEDERIRNIGHTLGSVNQVLEASAPLDDSMLVERLKVLY
jgi:hypothetical protein